MLQSTRKRRNSRNSADYEWAEREKKRLELKAQELMERTRASQVSKKLISHPSTLLQQEAARKKQEDNEKKVREEAEKLVWFL